MRKFQECPQWLQEKQPWWKFWHPCSGPVGGFIMSMVLIILLVTALGGF